MKREVISQGVGGISTRYIQEAADYDAGRRKSGQAKGHFVKNVIAAVLVLGIIACGIAVIAPSGDKVITAYAYGTDEEITAAGAILHTGRIRDTGEMTGKPLMFYLTGKDIAKVRFSCKNQLISFVDWTEQRGEYGNAQNFTVVYGEDESEYYYLTIDWVPDGTIRELTDNEDSRIGNLPEELREDMIVMEITFGSGETMTKAVAISLQEDGTFFASFDDYEIKDSDTFVKRPDSEALLQENMQLQDNGQSRESMQAQGNVSPQGSMQLQGNGQPRETMQLQDNVLSQESMQPQDNSQSRENMRLQDNERPQGTEEDGQVMGSTGGTVKQEDNDCGNKESINSEDKHDKTDTHPVSLTVEQIEAAKQTALAYYEGTVFSINTIEYLEEKPPYADMEGDCSFIVNVSKGGVIQEPDRMITLRIEDGEWKVVNEGY